MRPGFLNDNANRNFPFLEGTTGFEQPAVSNFGLYPEELFDAQLFPTELFPPFNVDDVVDTGALRSLPTSAMVDAGFLMGLGSGYVEGEHSVWLTHVARVGTRLDFTFQSDAPGLVDQSITFCRSISDEPYATSFYEQDEPIETETVSCTVFPDELLPPEIFPAALFPCTTVFQAPPSSSECNVFPSELMPEEIFPSELFPCAVDDSSSSSESSEVLEVCERPLLWTGFITTGPLDDLVELLDDGQVMTGQLAIEPGLIRSAISAWLQSANLANGDRTRAETADQCREYCWPFDPGSVFVQAECLQGRLRFKEGYNCSIRQNDTENSITISAVVGGGIGEPCDEVPLFDGDSGPTGETLLTGGPSCGELIRSINGAGGARLDIIGGVGVSVTALPDDNKLVVDVDMSRLAICNVDDSSEYSYEGPDYGDDDCDCGPT